MAGFVRLPLQRNVQKGLEKSANIQGGSVFLGASFEKFHCIRFTLSYKMLKVLSVTEFDRMKSSVILCTP
jgi:hypothetical protein